ncbi:MAG: hypothetical protein HY579_08835 [Nitrospinae bacterium]|nr:hypothetical protein [Nitrospinota bacterium]
MEINEIHCQSILTRTSGYLKEVCSHSLNPYVGCGFGRSSCGEGCYVRFNPWLTKGRVWGGFVDVKVNAAEAYLRTCAAERAWARKRKKVFAIFLSSSADPWQPLESRFRATRGVLAAMRESPPDKLILQTHTARVRDDLPLIKTLSGLCELRVHVSIEGDIERLPGLPPPPCSLDERIGVLEQFSAAGIKTVACLSPLYPLREPAAFFQRLARTGIAAAVIDHFVEGDGTADGSRTLKTDLPRAMEAVCPGSTLLSYREEMICLARKSLPVGVSWRGFAGIYST